MGGVIEQIVNTGRRATGINIPNPLGTLGSFTGGGLGGLINGGGSTELLGAGGGLAGLTSGLGLGSLLGDITGSNATRDAIDAQTEATKEANATQRYMYDTSRADLQPWRQAGMQALPQLQNADFQRDFTAADFQADPGYAFRMAEGQKAIERSAAARGGLGSGATLKELTKYSQGVASDEYNNAYNRFNADRDRRFNRLSALAGVGQTANTQVVNNNQNYANQVSGNQIGLGNSIASANIAQSNRNAQLLGQGAGAAALAFSDERLKTDIEAISKEDLAELRAAIKPYRFKYVSDVYGEGDWIGVMAQDLEKTKLGRTIVTEDENGNKMIDGRKVISLFLATLAEVR